MRQPKNETHKQLITAAHNKILEENVNNTKRGHWRPSTYTTTTTTAAAAAAAAEEHHPR